MDETNRLLQRLCEAVEKIAVSLDGLSVEPLACAHPAELKENFSTMGRIAWRCKGCGFSVGMETVAVHG